uniref:Uncharacterized protein n=1 Tax=Trichuris muris TaxID=70415 RepID=A0A5S6QAX3_TRIMR
MFRPNRLLSTITTQCHAGYNTPPPQVDTTRTALNTLYKTIIKYDHDKSVIARTVVYGVWPPDEELKVHTDTVLLPASAGSGTLPSTFLSRKRFQPRSIQYCRHSRFAN